jgi:hypothetical protein
MVDPAGVYQSQIGKPHILHGPAHHADIPWTLGSNQDN